MADSLQLLRLPSQLQFRLIYANIQSIQINIQSNVFLFFFSLNSIKQFHEVYLIAINYHN